MGMRFKKVEMQNFGPYFGLHTLVFGLQRPIVVIHGQNMAGKTSLLNAIRWVLYGHALNRFGKPMPLKHLINSAASESGNWIMSVKLLFEVDNSQYELERSIQPKDSSVPPRSEDDFDIKIFLRVDGRYLNPGEVQTEINRILPEQISRFFLFDGELLNEYETLLADSAKQAGLIKESIEHILGVPVITNSIADLREHLKEASRRQQNLAKRDQKANVFATQAAILGSKIAMLEKDLEEFNEHYNSLYQRQRELDDILQASASIEVDVQRYQFLDEQRRSLREEEQQLQQENRGMLVNAWRDLLHPFVQRHLADLEKEHNKLFNIMKVSGELQAKIDDIEKILTQGKCPVCGQISVGLDPADLQSQKSHFEQEIAALSFDQQHFSQISAAIQKFRKIQPSHTLATVSKNEKRLSQIRVDVANLEFQIDEINNRLKGHNRSEIARNRRDYNDITKELGVVENLIGTKNREISNLQEEATKIRRLIGKEAGPEMQRLNREVQLCDDLVHLFESTLAILRDDLRKSVERDASSIFLNLTTDQSYQGLRINENYGLTILDSRGKEVQVRSAGAEQIVAFSLIGALNRNAVRQGPIIMDTPFGRLDPHHRENILRFIPTLAEQITLLVHGGEINREQDLQNIRDQIDQEYTILHPSSHISELSKPIT